MNWRHLIRMIFLHPDHMIFLHPDHMIVLRQDHKILTRQDHRDLLLLPHNGTSDYYDRTLDIDDSILVLVALNGDVPLSAPWSIFANVGFQASFDKGAATTTAFPSVVYQAGDSEMQAFFGSLGLSYAF